MKNKPRDKFYCGVRKEIIKMRIPKLNRKNFELLKYWISERYKIHLKKDIQKLSPPWTKDEILQKYRFTNVRREHDKETKWLIKNICLNQKLTYENKILNTILFRLFNKSSTVEEIGLINFDREFSFKKMNKNKIYFSNAFFTSGPKTTANKLFPNEKNMTNKIIKLVYYHKKLTIADRIKSSENQKQVFDNLLSMPGIGKFLAYQIFVDLTYMEEFLFSENEFTAAGPGCIKGLKLIFDDFDKMNYEEALFWLRDNQNLFNFNNLFQDLEEYDKKINVMSLENCMCEISKYIRACNGKGRLRAKYVIKW